MPKNPKLQKLSNCFTAASLVGTAVLAARLHQLDNKGREECNKFLDAAATCRPQIQETRTELGKLGYHFLSDNSVNFEAPMPNSLSCEQIASVHAEIEKVLKVCDPLIRNNRSYPLSVTDDVNIAEIRKKFSRPVMSWWLLNGDIKKKQQTRCP